MQPPVKPKSKKYFFPARISAIKLSVYLNYAIFMYQVEKDKKEALRLLNKQMKNALYMFEKWPEG